MLSQFIIVTTGVKEKKMKRLTVSLALIALTAMLTLGLASCNNPFCQHRDADDDSLCDKCSEPYTDGKDIEDTPACQHRDADDDSLCDKCGKPYTDGKDVEDKPICQHRDADDDSLCDKCGDPYTDGYDVGTEGLVYTLQGDGTYSVTDYTGTATDVVIPSTHEGKAVTSIGWYAFGDCTGLTSIEIPDSVTSIDEGAFHNCSGFTSIEIPDSVTYIGSCAFYNCSSLTSAVIGDSVKNISDDAFASCTSLTSVVIGDSVTSIDPYAFANCTGLTSVVIPASVKNIDAWAFEDCTGLTSIEIPDSVTYIGPCAFEECSSLMSIVIPESVTSIGDEAFTDCTSLTSVAIPDSLISIGKDVFSGCSRLTYNEYDNAYYLGNDNNPYVVLMKAKSNSIISCEINASTRLIFSTAFIGCTSLTNIEIPNSVTSIGEDTFSGCSSLTSVVIPESVTNIGEDAFSGCSGLTYSEYNNAYYLGNDNNPYVVLAKAKSNSITSCEINANTRLIFSSAFSGCTSIASVEIPDSVTSIGSYAFEGCTGLTSIEIPGSVIIVAPYAFSGCASLTSIEIPDSVTSIGWYAFHNCTSLTSIKYRGTEDQWKDISKGWGWDLNVGNYTITYNYTEDLFTYSKIETGYAVSGLTDEGKRVKALTLPTTYNGERVVVIAKDTFSGAAVEKLIITENTNLRKIENGAFDRASNLSSIYIYQFDAESILPPEDFSGAHEDLKIYVPEGSFYDTDYYWSQVPYIADMIEFMEHGDADGIVFSYEIVNAVDPGAMCVIGGKIKLTVRYKADNVSLANVYLCLSYDTSVLEFVSGDFMCDAVDAAGNRIFGINNAAIGGRSAGFVAVTARTFGFGEVPVDKILDGEGVFAEIYFNIKRNLDDEAKIAFEVEKVGNFASQVLKADGSVVEADFGAPPVEDISLWLPID